MGLDTLWQHKLRSLLTILGVVIGTMTVIVIAAFVSGIDARVSKEIESFGTNSIYIYRFDPGFNFNPSPKSACASRSATKTLWRFSCRVSFSNLCRGVHVAG